MTKKINSNIDSGINVNNPYKTVGLLSSIENMVAKNRKEVKNQEAEMESVDLSIDNKVDSKKDQILNSMANPFLDIPNPLTGAGTTIGENGTRIKYAKKTKAALGIYYYDEKGHEIKFIKNDGTVKLNNYSQEGELKGYKKYFLDGTVQTTELLSNGYISYVHDADKKIISKTETLKIGDLTFIREYLQDGSIKITEDSYDGSTTYVYKNSEDAKEHLPQLIKTSLEGFNKNKLKEIIQNYLQLIDSDIIVEDCEVDDLNYIFRLTVTLKGGKTIEINQNGIMLDEEVISIGHNRIIVDDIIINTNLSEEDQEEIRKLADLKSDTLIMGYTTVNIDGKSVKFYIMEGALLSDVIATVKGFTEALEKYPSALRSILFNEGFNGFFIGSSSYYNYDSDYLAIYDPTYKIIYYNSDEECNTEYLEQTASHELGHAIDFLINENGLISDIPEIEDLYNKYKIVLQSLPEIGYDQERYPEGIPSTCEFFAEVIGEYFNYPEELEALAPELYEYIDNLFKIAPFIYNLNNFLKN